MAELISNKQKQVIHAAARKAGLIDKYNCKQQYLLVLKNVTGKNSSTKLTQPDYDKLADYFWDTYEIDIGGGGNNSTVSTRQQYRIDKLLAELPGVNLAGVIHQITGDASSLEELRLFEINKVIDALNAIKARIKKPHNLKGKEQEDTNETSEVKADQLDRRKGETGR